MNALDLMIRQWCKEHEAAWDWVPMYKSTSKDPLRMDVYNPVVHAKSIGFRLVCVELSADRSVYGDQQLVAVIPDDGGPTVFVHTNTVGQALDVMAKWTGTEVSITDLEFEEIEGRPSWLNLFR